MGTLSVDKLVKTSQGAAEFTLPATDGAAGTVWQTDGSGQLSVATVGSSGIATDAVTATQIAANAVTAYRDCSNYYYSCTGWRIQLFLLIETLCEMVLCKYLNEALQLQAKRDQTHTQLVMDGGFLYSTIANIYIFTRNFDSR